MALTAVEGIFRDGRVELAETPEGVEEARVMVVFLPGPGPKAAPVDKRDAGAKLIARLRQGIDFGGERFDREELYADRLDQLGRGAG